ncbi:undecaprenyl-phosphate glucose phosphotransferase [Bosea sp. BH3]|uniref:undecaprenyl-phosphate glucose phosphotransferase n=1 Tax=Bosea sp. BH3 TaxID=2871701 RepID=UPI0021CB8E11|nr:undecaprenyl-phosphate glucose phosphotransferase [Bosea sp. BH3]MCU4181167.1 undecaprenyl-phosphate glucose phosphotransferase [Bosea sp. BH3]
MVADVLTIVATSLLCSVGYNLFRGGEVYLLADALALGVLFASLFVLLMQWRGLYRPLELLRPLRQVSSAFTVWILVVCFLAAIGFALKSGHLVSRVGAITFMMTGFLGVAALRFGWHGFMNRALNKGRFATRRIAVIGDDAFIEESRLAQNLVPYGFSIAARVRLPAGDAAAETAVVSDLITRLRGSQIEEVLVAVEDGDFKRAQQVIAALRILPLPVKLVLGSGLGELAVRPVERFGGGLVAVEMHRAPMSQVERAVKRGLDIAIAGIAILLISPLLVMTALAIRLDSPGPILFKQTRNGFNNRQFRILKFRSMHVMEDGEVVRQALRHDSRVTSVGRWIRKLSIDELPQLWNVLRGDMSIVGPRPHALAHDEHYEQLIGDYPYRQHVKPGITGWAQVNGSRGETPTTESMAERVRLDIWYVENASFWLDLRIMARTLTTLMDLRQTY